MEMFYASILSVFWDGKGRLILGLPFLCNGYRFCLQLAPDLFAEFECDSMYGSGDYADSGPIIARATGFAGLTGVSATAAYPVLCPANAPVCRASAEAALFSTLFAGLRLTPEASAPAQKERPAAPDLVEA